MHPFQKMGSDEVLEPRGGIGYKRPVELIVLLLLLDGSKPRGPEGSEAEDGVEAFENSKPVRDCLVSDLQVFAQRVDRER
jgi:hypothetical protein